MPALVWLYQDFHLVRNKFSSCLCLYHAGSLSSKWTHMLTNTGSDSCHIPIKNSSSNNNETFLWFVQMTAGSWRMSVDYCKFKQVMILNAGAIQYDLFSWVSQLKRSIRKCQFILLPSSPHFRTLSLLRDGQPTFNAEFLEQVGLQAKVELLIFKKNDVRKRFSYLLCIIWSFMGILQNTYLDYWIEN